MAEEKKILEENEVDLVELVKAIWTERGLIVKVTSLFIILGLIIAFTSKVEYEASCKLLPESQNSAKSGLGGLSGLAGLAGINLDLTTGGSDLSPEIYPEIVNSLPVQLRLINDTLSFQSKGLKTSSNDYFLNHVSPTFFGYIVKYTIGLPGLIKSGFASTKAIKVSDQNEFYTLTKQEWNAIESFRSRININIDIESGLINIFVQMPDALAAAQLTNNVVNELTDQVIKYKTKKAKDNLDFVQDTYYEAEKKFERIQMQLATATDRNKHINSASANIQFQTLQTEHSLAFEVYKELAGQLEQAKIKLKQETPVFTVLDPVRVPESKSKPKRMIILISNILIGFIGSCIFLIVKFLFYAK